MDEPLNKTSPLIDEVHPLDYLIVLAKHSRMIVYTTVMVGVLTFLILLLVPNKFTATASILPPQQNMTLSGQLLDQLGGTALPANTAGGGLAASLLGLKTPGELYVGILTSNHILDLIIERFNLRHLYKSWLSSNDPYIEDVRKELTNRTNINVDKNGIITIEVTDESPAPCRRDGQCLCGNTGHGATRHR